MEPTLDETSLVPCPEWPPASRIAALSNLLKAFDRIGMPRILRSVSDAADRDIAQGRGLRSWCFERGANRDAGLFVALRLARQPFIDGTNGLMARAEGQRVLETRANGTLVFGLGLGALEGRPVASLASRATPIGRQVQVQILDASLDANVVTDVPVFAYVRDDEVAANALALQALVDASMPNGQALLGRFADVFPHLRLGPRALESFAALSGSEPVFCQLIRHLRALNAAAERWVAGTPYRPEGITFGQESEQTLSHVRFGPIRDFPPPEGFQHERWSLHTKLTGGAGARLYFRAVRTAQTRAVLIGYFGSHLPCVLYPT
jgi:hypothetical protein